MLSRTCGVTVLLVGVGGFLGATARYVVDLALTAVIGGRFPVGILVVNVSGAFVLGLLYAVTDRGMLPDGIRAPLFIGFIGAYTTFSTWTLDTWRLIEAGAVTMAALNLVGAALLGMVAVVAGLAVGRAI